MLLSPLWVLVAVAATTQAATGPLNCNFDVNLCKWKQVKGKDQLNWTRHKGGTTSAATGPSRDHTTGHGYYMYLETSTGKLNYKAQLISPALTIPTKHTFCYTFWYHMYGQQINALNVYFQHGTTLGRAVWTKKGTHGNVWLRAQINIPAGHIQVVMEAVKGLTYQGDIAIDDTSMTNGRCHVSATTPKPHTTPVTTFCNFENPNICYWKQDNKTDNFDWTRGHGRTGAVGTGPTVDHTYGTAADLQLQNSTTNVTTDLSVFREERSMYRLQLLMGPLVIAGTVHCLLGALGLVGFLLRFIGPVTIVPTMTLMAIYIAKIVVKFSSVHWGISLFTAAVALFLSMHMVNYQSPIPMWTKKKGFHIIYYPLHQVFALLIAIIIGWIVSAVVTAAGGFSDDPTSNQYFARTDSRTYIIQTMGWFVFPYPGQFGAPRYSTGVLTGFLIATMTSIIDSIGDYYACCSISRVPPPPPHATNRGIAIEGFGTIISGLLGAGHATTTYGGNIGVIGITKVASRRVFVAVGCMYIVMGVIGKFGAVFISIPYSVIGGGQLIYFGIFTGIVLSNMKHIDLNSTRNLAVIGISITIGLAIQEWVHSNPEGIDTGNDSANNAFRMLLGNPAFAGGFLACFLDNTVPGTLEERGINNWLSPSSEGKDSYKETSNDVYGLPFLPSFISNSRLATLIPFMPGYKTSGIAARED